MNHQYTQRIVQSKAHAFWNQWASGVFQRTIETVLKNTPNTFIHMDDILVSGKTRKEHDTNLEQVFHKLQTAGFRVKKEKCILAVKQLTFLAHNISDQGISPLQDKVEAILQVPAPKDVTQLQACLGYNITDDSYQTCQQSLNPYTVFLIKGHELRSLIGVKAIRRHSIEQKNCFRQVKYWCTMILTNQLFLQLIRLSTVLARYCHTRWRMEMKNR